MPTEREAVARERAAWDEAADFFRHTLSAGRGGEFSKQARDRRYPLPKTTRPRVVKDPIGPYEWRCVDGELEYRLPDVELSWRDGSPLGWSLTPARVALWADLIERPTEDVEEEG